MKTRMFTGVDGLELAGYEWQPEGEPKAILQIAHGMAEHAQRYAYVAEAFNQAGWLVVAHDHRGHGQSVPQGQAPGHMADEDSWTKAVDDLHLVNRAIAGEHPNLPLVLLAHSMGSFMAQALATQHPDDFVGLALSGSNGKPPAIAHAGRLVTRIERLRLGGQRSSNLLQKLSFGAYNEGFEGRTEFDWLSRDEGQVDAYVADPLCGFAITVQSWLDLLDALVGLTDPAKLAHIPKDKSIYIFAGDRDPVSEQAAGVRRLAESYRRAGLTDITLKLYAGGRHEILNETNREEVVNDLLSWAGELLADA